MVDRMFREKTLMRPGRFRFAAPTRVSVVLG